MSAHPSPGTPNTSTSSTPTTLSQATYTSLKPCSHLAQVLNSNARDTVLRNYSLAVKVSNFNNLSSFNLPRLKNKKNEKGRLEKQRLMHLKSKALRCRDCLECISGTFMCLQCPHVGCWEKNHFVNHAKKQGHIFGIDGQLGYLFCFKCGDYTSDAELEAMRLRMTFKESTEAEILGSDHDDKLVAKYTRSINFKPTTGLRGFVNMGSTCFMSSVMQTFIHNPIIRDYFLTEGHMDCSKGKDECITCSVDEIFTEFYTMNTTSGYGPVSLLNAAWRTNKSLAGYSEQDAHEFWQFMVEQLHQGLMPGHDSHAACSCVLHKTFSSDLLSSITCTKCGNVTSTVDPIIDISLGISQSDDLMTCFKNFTKNEKLDIKYNCSNCHERTHATKQLSILKFPNTLAIQLKRFEHNAQSVKLEKYIKFPMFMNMSEFSSSYTKTGKFDPQLTYELFAVVCHIGSVNTGHYVVVVKNNQGRWFKFDDSMVTLMSVEKVSQLKAYLLFYMVHKLA